MNQKNDDDQITLRVVVGGEIVLLNKNKFFSKVEFRIVQGIMINII